MRPSGTASPRRRSTSTRRRSTPARSSRHPPAPSAEATPSCSRSPTGPAPIILTNDSFQEFHGEHPWLFDEGRLIGGKPVPHVGWVFLPRSPVRGAKSRMSVKEQRRKDAGGCQRPTKSGGSRRNDERGRRKRRRRAPAPRRAADARRPAAVAATAAPATKRRAREKQAPDDEVDAAQQARGRRRSPGQYLNDALPFIEFVARASRSAPRSTARSTSFSSHGAYVATAGARCVPPAQGDGRPGAAQRARGAATRRGPRRSPSIE